MSFQFCWFYRANKRKWVAQLLIRQIWLFVVCLGIGGSIVLGVPAEAGATDYNKQFLVGANFSGRSLTDDSFTKANLRYSNFSHSDLRGVSFFGANLEAANLEGATLSYATLDSARFVEANLTNAVLEGAFAFNANFDGAIIDGADFTDVLLRQDVQEQLCEMAQGTNPVTGRDTQETLECVFLN